MSISVDGANHAAKLQELFSEQLKGKTLNGTESGSSVILNGDSVTITARDPDSGATAAKTVSAEATGFKQFAGTAAQTLYVSAEATEEMAAILTAYAEQTGETPPAAGSATPKLPATTLGEVAESLKNLSSELEECNTRTDGTEEYVETQPTDSQDVFFSIYDLASLLLEIGQKERDAAREVKQAELNAEVASINTQANKQREAGVLGAIVTGVTMTMQVAALAATTAASASATAKAENNPSSAQQAGVAESKSTTLEAQAKGPEAAQKNLNKVSSKTSAEAKTRVYTAMKEAGVPEAKANYESAKLSEAKVTEEMTAFKTSEQSKLDSLMNSGRVDNDAVMECKSNISMADDTIAAAQERTATAKGNYESAITKAETNVNSQFEKSCTKTSELETTALTSKSKANTKAATASEKSLKTDAQAAKLMDAEAAKARADMGETPTKGDVAAAKGNAAAAQKAKINDPTYKTMSGKGAASAAMLQQLPGMIGQLGQSCAQMVSSIYNSEATAEQANQKEAEADREETTQLMNQAQDLINTARDFLKAVMQAESQSIENIIRA